LASVLARGLFADGHVRATRDADRVPGLREDDAKTRKAAHDFERPPAAHLVAVVEVDL
jgi:hypothetical protein